MTLPQFIQENNGKRIGNTPENMGECVGCVSRWQDALGVPHEWGHAYQLLENADPTYFDVIKNTPDAIVQIGDIVVWTKGFNNTFGHTAIAVKGDINTFEVFEQNNPLGSPCRLHTYKDYAYVDGWLRLKKLVDTPQSFNFTDQTLIPCKQYGEIELQAIVGKLGEMEALKKDNEGLKTNLENVMAYRDRYLARVIELEDQLKTAKLPTTSLPEIPKTAATTLDDLEPDTIWDTGLTRLFMWIKSKFGS